MFGLGPEPTLAPNGVHHGRAKDTMHAATAPLHIDGRKIHLHHTLSERSKRHCHPPGRFLLHPEHQQRFRRRSPDIKAIIIDVSLFTAIRNESLWHSEPCLLCDMQSAAEDLPLQCSPRIYRHMTESTTLAESLAQGERKISERQGIDREPRRNRDNTSNNTSNDSPQYLIAAFTHCLTWALLHPPLEYGPEMYGMFLAVRANRFLGPPQPTYLGEGIVNICPDEMLGIKGHSPMETELHGSMECFVSHLLQGTTIKDTNAMTRLCLDSQFLPSPLEDIADFLNIEQVMKFIKSQLTDFETGACASLLRSSGQRADNIEQAHRSHHGITGNKRHERDAIGSSASLLQNTDRKTKNELCSEGLVQIVCGMESPRGARLENGRTAAPLRALNNGQAIWYIFCAQLRCGSSSLPSELSPKLSGSECRSQTLPCGLNNSKKDSKSHGFKTSGFACPALA
ncbi:hypothetical protein CFD26_103469 [Aspergillus turcosus]|uniref:Uncharacterized protein n=1 Tax=Aspergillus turcosus TaxID=1245748 RepID=A0A3R7HT81_9EURO|nr:hypothetical protein CFD26_103469 [Aspergillus turcosus]